jgi:hypothetical protein
MTDDTTDDLHTILAEVNQLVRAAYERGFQAGGIAMRNSIIAAANAPMTLKGGSLTMSTGPFESGRVYDLDLSARRETAGAGGGGGPRAPRGLVANLIRIALTNTPGQTIVDLEKTVQMMDSRVNRKTVGNQMRRFDGVLYERNGHRWYLKGQKQSAEDPGKDSSADTWAV